VDLDFRPTDPATDDLEAWRENIALVFHDSRPQTPERLATQRPRYAGQRLTGAWDGDLCVGTFRSWDTTLTVPGGNVVADAVSSVTVRPTHRRRGILTRLMTDDLGAAAARGVPVAILFASEGLIYPRYGYGVATWTATFEVDRARAALRPDVPRVGRVDVVPAARAREVVDVVFPAARRPGEIDHFGYWWDDSFGLVPGPDAPVGRRSAVHTAPDGTPTGCLRYAVEEKWDDRRVATVVDVKELRASTPQAYAALWRYLLELDLVATVRATEQPVDDPLPHLLTDVRAVRRTGLSDFQWHRLLDPAAALSARTYERDGAVTFEVVDRAGGWAAGTFTLDVTDGRGVCTRSPGVQAEVSVPVDVLSSVWLGGGDLHAVGRAGLALEHRDGALARLAGMLATTAAPYTRTIF
jgi:predicted acetyltransferase